YMQPLEADGHGNDVYIVYMEIKRFEQTHLNTEMHYEILTSLLGSHEAAALAMIYSYNHSFSGFAAKLNATDVMTLSTMEGVVFVFKSEVLELHKTHSWNFMGMGSDDLTRMPVQETVHGEGDIVIGFLDSGIWPESQSFKDDTLPPPLSSWKGVCQEGEKFSKSNCNRKLVGARWYSKGYEESLGALNTSITLEYRSARDQEGHGTHTASTGGGRAVQNPSFLGLGRGIARGGADRARIAICAGADILAAFHDAISDGVDVISVSLGSSPPLPDYFSSSSDIGSFHAMEKGITAVFSAGNDGPDPASVANTAPWGITVAASTMDRSFPTNIMLGNNKSIKGQGINTQRPSDTFVPLVDGASSSGSGVRPLVRISPSRSSLKHTPAPVVAYFSSRGPSTLSPDILKPDITAPGVNILAAWPPVIPPSDVSIDKRVVNCNFLSGTSMSCPHVSGIVALLKSIHPKWSPAAIKSAIMTTAYVIDTSFDLIKAGESGKPANPFDFGAGHVNPVQAMKPGLIYDAGPADYVVFLCSLGYTEKNIRAIVSSAKLNTTCPKHGSSASDVNYPSIAVSNLESITTIKRTVTNVGPEVNSVNRALVSSPPGVEVIVKPMVLVFTRHITSVTFSVTLRPVKHSDGVYNFGALIWFSRNHFVQSPIAVRVNNIKDEYAEKIHDAVSAV
ncbi:hypothetical protein KI387_022609, partial [Taxus chinensis]